MVSHTIINDEYPLCTSQMCTEENPCCKNCGSIPKFDNINLVGREGGLVLGCGGTDCNYMDNCIYNNGDNVLVYGTVDSYGWTIIFDQHCLYDPDININTDVTNNTDDATNIALSSKSEEEKEDSKCQELSNAFMLPNTNYCMQVLGIGVYNDTCAYISGCSANGYAFFTSMLECRFTCNKIIKNVNDSDNNAVTTTTDDIQVSTGDNNTSNIVNDTNTTIPSDEENQSIDNNETIIPSTIITPENQAYAVRKTWIVLCNCFIWSFILCNV